MCAYKNVARELPLFLARPISTTEPMWDKWYVHSAHTYTTTPHPRFPYHLQCGLVTGGCASVCVPKIRIVSMYKTNESTRLRTKYQYLYVFPHAWHGMAPMAPNQPTHPCQTHIYCILYYGGGIYNWRRNTLSMHGTLFFISNITLCICSAGLYWAVLCMPCMNMNHSHFYILFEIRILFGRWNGLVWRYPFESWF